MKTKLEGSNYKQRVEEQLKEWAKGNSIHNHIEDECCPDFSCCKPEFKADEETRLVFLNANQEQRESLLYCFLGTAIGNLTDKKIHIVNGKDEINSQLN